MEPTRDDDGRYLLIRMRMLPPGSDGIPKAKTEFAVVRGFELGDYYEQSGWKVVVQDPWPNYYAPFARNEDDCA